MADHWGHPAREKGSTLEMSEVQALLLEAAKLLPVLVQVFLLQFRVFPVRAFCPYQVGWDFVFDSQGRR